MKTSFFPVLFFAFTLNQITTHAATFSNAAVYASADSAKRCSLTATEKGANPSEIKVVFSQKRIWLLADEMPMKCLKTQVKDISGKVVLEKCFTSKCAEWSLNIEALPKGEYTLYLGTERVEKFKK